MVETSYIMCWSAKWLDDPAMVYRESFDRSNVKKYRASLMTLHGLLDRADVVVHYYGSKFDIPTVNRELVKLKIPPPSPYRQIDIKLHVAGVYKFESNKLDYVAEQLGYGKKLKTDFTLWVDCMHGNRKQQARMGEYNRHDVILLEKVYNRLRPWIRNHPNASVWQESNLVCPKCKSDKYQQRGFAYTQVAKYARFQCNACRGWFRANCNELPKRPVKFVTI
jgi:uncharacterized protein YprB with RNaseH-like and TPR domain